MSWVNSLSMCLHSSVDCQNFSANLMVYTFCSGFVVGKALNKTPAQGGSWGQCWILVTHLSKRLTVSNDCSADIWSAKKKQWALTKVKEPDQKHKTTSSVRRECYGFKLIHCEIPARSLCRYVLHPSKSPVVCDLKGMFRVEETATTALYIGVSMPWA